MKTAVFTINNQTTSMKNKFLVAPAILCSLIATATLNSCSSSAGKKTETTQAAPPAAAETFILKKDKLATDIQIPGELTAYQQVDLYAKVNSFVKQVKVDIGSQVVAGQLLVTLEAPELAAQSLGAASRLKSQEAIYTASNATYNRLLETSKTPGTVSQNDLDIALARKKSDFAQLESVRSAYSEVNTINNYLQIRAPFNGIITARNVNAGAYVGKAAELPMFTLQEQMRLRLSVAVPEAYTGYLKNEDEVQFKVKSLPAETFTANVKRKAGALDPRLRAERIEMDVMNRDKKLLPGMIAEISLHLSGADSTFVVPKSALVSSAEGLFIIKVVNGQAERVPVRKGRDNGGKIEVFGPLNTGDTFLLKGSEEIRNGAKITV
jgi:membrane fusion protein (multidrug efflux system)